MMKKVSTRKSQTARDLPRTQYLMWRRLWLDAHIFSVCCDMIYISYTWNRVNISTVSPGWTNWQYKRNPAESSSQAESVDTGRWTGQAVPVFCPEAQLFSLSRSVRFQVWDSTGTADGTNDGHEWVSIRRRHCDGDGDGDIWCLLYRSRV